MNRVDWAYVKSIIAKKLAIDSEKISLDDSFTKDLGATSFELTDLIVTFRNELNIEMPDEEAKELVTVRNLLDYLVRRIK
jgi:acyl carrier protein